MPDLTGKGWRHENLKERTPDSIFDHDYCWDIEFHGCGWRQKTTEIISGRETLDLYIKQDQKTFRLPQQGLTFKTALVLGSDQSGLYGIPSPPKTSLDIKPIEIVFFDPETAGATIRLTKLAHIATAPAHSFDLQATKIGPAIFAKIYHVKYDESVPINLWCVETDIPLQITPMAGKPGWFRAVPEQQLEAGVFAITFGRVDGPRIYAGDRYFYPFVLASARSP